ncbi:unknown protein [Seminavis robusta]|uniref:Transmembrane protein n=1 Tax=Seminavis robusta TaxID=568900 RepID=A0A9N8DQT9_9STRA|nr:unknown protein [Seminavis robusta]|eukprot:Sro306_g112950.1 n/a (183) ;mRNA; r:27918-28466
MMRKIALLLLGLLALATTSEAFRPRQQALAKSAPFQNDNTHEKSPLTTATSAVPRGGEILGKNKAFFVKMHAYVCFFQALHFTLESCGIKVPIMGLSATIADTDFSSPGTATVLRMLAAFVLFTGLIELDLADHPVTQKSFSIYHVGLTTATVLGSLAAPTGPMSYVLPSLVGLFLVLSLLA